MKEYVNKILRAGEDLLQNSSVSSEHIDEFERHIGYCCHERQVHLLVTLSFAIMTMLALFVMMYFTGIATLLLFVIFMIMTAAYAWHYYFLENSVQKMYNISDELRKNKL